MVDLSDRSKLRVWVGTIVGTLLCVAVAMIVASFNFANIDQAQLRRSVAINIWLPVFLAGPLLFLLLSKIRQLAIAHEEMAVLASTDNLTAVLNRGAFTMLAEAHLAQPLEPFLVGGSLLVIDVDHFKVVNDRYGHQTGDEVLRQIAICIKAKLRATDLIGRIGGEEFAVFLPGASNSQAEAIADRIRRDVIDLGLPEGNAKHPVTVSIGGTSFQEKRSYEQLFKVADLCLYEAKGAGRNQVKMMSLPKRAA